jgi:tetratricopeptide (TPR) repeat protein
LEVYKLTENKRKVTTSLNKVRADKETQLFLKRSNLEFSDEVKVIEGELVKDPTNPDLWVKKATALSKQMLYREAAEAASKGLTYDPFNWMLLRCRAGRHLATYRFQEAAADFELASRINNKDWNIWYHLGLAYYLLGEYDRANEAYTKCLEITEPNDVNLVAIVDWKWLTLIRLGKIDEAKKLLELVDENTDSGENIPYHERVLAYKGVLTPERVLEFENEDFRGLEFATRGYGIAMYYIYNNKAEKGKELLGKIYQDDSFWNSFGYMATSVELKRLEILPKHIIDKLL